MLDPDELDAIRMAIQGSRPGTAQFRAEGDPDAMPVAIIADDRAAERGRPNGLKLAARWARLIEKQLARLTGGGRFSIAVAGVDSVDGAGAKAETADGWVARVGAEGADGIISVNGGLIEAVVARLLGDTTATPPGDRPPSPVARRLFAPAGTAVMAALVDAWRDELGGDVAPMPGGDEWRRALADADVVLAVSLASTNPTGVIRLVARPELFVISPGPAVAPPAPLAVVEAVLGEVPLLVDVELGRARMTLADLRALRPGDVIGLDRMLDDLLPVSCGGILKARGKPVADRGAIAIEIVDTVKRGDKHP
jgi:flagellar motor switch protein FliM